MLGDPRRWNHLVRKPLAVGDCALSSKEATDLLQAVGVPSTLVDGIFDVFARRKQRSNCWSRAVGEVPERRADALELFAGLALTCRATVEEKLSTIFSLFDCGETGVLVEDDIGALISSCASFLCRLGLSAPISNDEAAFVAGGVFARTKESASASSTLLYADGISLPGFLSWAQKATLPVGALELLTLPHRFSGALGLVSAELSLLGERYASRRSAGDRLKPRCQPHWKTKFAHLKRSSGLPRGSSVGGHNLTFVLPPVMHRISSTDAKVVLEASPSGAPTAAGAIWHAVVTIEERSGSRFFVVDCQPIILRGGVPTVLLFSELQAETDHRVQLLWNVCKPKGQTVRGRSNEQVGKQGCRTLRFTTISESPTGIDESPSQMGTSPTLSPGRNSDTHVRRSIHVITANSYVPNNNLLGASPPPSSSAGAKGRNKTVMGRNVSVVISHQQAFSLDSMDEHLDMKPWWATPRLSNGIKSSETIDQSALQSRRQNELPLTRAIDPDLTTPSAPGMAPSHGNVLDVPTSGEVQSHCWGAGGSRSNDIDVVVHLSPSLRAMGAIRRCFHILEESRFETLAVREDVRGMVTLEAAKAIKSLFKKTWQFQGHAPSDRDSARKSCAHVVLGAPDPWLGINEVRFSQARYLERRLAFTYLR